MKTVEAQVLKESCTTLLDELDEQGVLITRGGEPIAKLLPIRHVPGAELIGSMKGKIEIHGDIFSTGETWDAES